MQVINIPLKVRVCWTWTNAVVVYWGTWIIQSIVNVINNTWAGTTTESKACLKRCIYPLRSRKKASNGLYFSQILWKTLKLGWTDFTEKLMLECLSSSWVTQSFITINMDTWAVAVHLKLTTHSVTEQFKYLIYNHVFEINLKLYL